MRLLELAEFGNPHPGSFIPILRDILRAARERGHDAELLLGASARGMRWIDDLRTEGLHVRVAPEGPDRALARWLDQVIEEAAVPTALHSHFTGFDVASALCAGRNPQASAYWHDHSILYRNPLTVARNVLKYAVLGRRRVEYVFCPSTDLAAQLRRRGMPRNRVIVVHNGIDADRFQPSTDEQGRRARREFGIPDDRAVLLIYGWDWHRKGGDLYLATVKRLREAGVDVFGFCVGGKEEAEAQARHLGISEHIRAIDQIPDPRPALAACSLFLAPSRGEGSPFAVQEALACGLPVVASEIPGHLVIGEGIEACSVVPNRVPDLADAVLKRLRDRDHRRNGDRARAAIIEGFSQRKWSNAILDLLERSVPAV